MKKLLAMGLMVLGVGIAHAQYTFIDLHNVVGDSTTADAIHNSLIAGNYEFWDGAVGGMAWSAQTGAETYRTSLISAYGSDGLDIVGQGSFGALGNHACIWRPSTGGLISLKPAGFVESYAFGVSGNQQVGFGYASTGGHRAFLWQGTAASAVNLHPVGYIGSQARATDGTYQVGYVTASGGGQRAMMWQGSALTTTLLHPGGNDHSQALGVDGGHQVGFSAGHAMLWSGSAASAIDLNPSGFTASAALGISGNYQVGWGTSPLTGPVALLWNGSASSYINLQQFVPPGYGQSEARAIDPITGDIVGFATDPNGYFHAALWRRTTTTNQPPIISLIGNHSVDELTELTIDVDATDPDPVLALSYTLTQFPAGMGIDSSTGIITWTPTEAQGPGDFPVTVVVDDNSGGTSTESFTVHVNEVNLEPVWSQMSAVTLAEGQALSSEFASVAPYASDPDEPVNGLTFSLVSGPSGMTVSPSGDLSWTPGEADGGQSFPITVRATDDGSPSLFSDDQFTVQVNEVNEPPELASIPDTSANELSFITFTAVGSDPDQPTQALTYSLSGAPAGAAINPLTGVFTWTPTEADGPMEVVIDVIVSDGIATATQSVRITVNEDNVPPQFTNLPTIIEADVDTSVSIGLMASDPDLPTQILTFSLISGPPGFDISPEGTANYWVGAGLAGQDWPITVAVTDGIATTQGTFILRVNAIPNSPPTLQAIPDQSVWEDMLCTFTASGSDPDVGQSLTYSLSGAVPYGAFINPTTGVFTFRPAPSQTPGAYTFNVVVTDNGVPALSATETITVEATLENRTATQAFCWGFNSSFQLGMGPGTFSVPTLNEYLIGFSIINGGVFHSFGRNASGNWFVWGAGNFGQLGVGAIFNAASPITSGAISGLKDVRGGTQHLVGLTPSANVATCGNNTNGELGLGFFGSQITQPVTVGGSSDTYRIASKSELTSFLITGSGRVRATGHNLYSELGVSGFGSQSSFSNTNVQAGAVQVESGGRFTLVLNANGEVLQCGTGLSSTSQFQPIAGLSNVVEIAAGTETAYALRSDGTVWGLGNNSRLQLGSAFLGSFSGTPVQIPALSQIIQIEAGRDCAWALGADGSVWAWGSNDYSALGLPGAASREVSQLAGLSGIDRISGMAYGCIAYRYGLINHAPVLAPIGNRTVDELTELVITTTASDPDSGQTLTYSLTGAPSGMTINPTTGVVNWTPTEAQGPGSYPVTITVTDNGTPTASDSEAITITVNEVNISPTIAAIPNQTVDELTIITFTAIGADADLPAQTLTYSLVGAPSGATINPSTGVFSWTPTEAQGPGSYTFDVKVADSGSPSLSAQQSVTITVIEANQAPTLAAIPNQAVDELQTLTFTASGSDSDLPAQTLTYSLIGAPAGATVDPNTGVFSWTPTEAQGPGSYTFDVKVADSGSPSLSAQQSVTVTVNEANQAPTLAAFPNQTVNEQDNLTFTADGADADLPAQALTYSLIGAPSGATINPGTGVFSWTPTEAQGPGTYTFDVKVTDDGLPSLSAQQSVTITVNEANQAPTLAAIPNQTVNELDTLAFTASGADADLPAQTLAYSLVGSPTGATINPATGVFSWTPTATQGGSYSFTVRVTDDGTPNLFDEEQVTVTVVNVNQPPVLTWPQNHRIRTGTALALDIDATDPDLPNDQLTFALENGPAGATIDSQTGQFSWTPTKDGTTIVQVKVTDIGGLSHTGLFSITSGSFGTAARAWGLNGTGQLGDGTTISRFIPTPVSGVSHVVSVEGGASHSLALLSDGTVRTWGLNNYGQLGDGTTTNRLVPTPVSGLTDVVAVAAGSYHSFALLSDGTVRAWGNNNAGQLGDGSSTSRLVPGPVSGLTNAVAVRAGHSHSFALLSDGSVRSWGNNIAGQLGDGSSTNRLVPGPVVGLTNVVDVKAGHYHSLALLSDGSVRSWGNNDDGQLGIGTTTNRLVPTPVSGLTNVTAIASGDAYGMALLNDGTARTWGLNAFGQLGNGTGTNRLVPTPVSGLTNVVSVEGGASHGLAIIKVPPTANAGTDVSISVPHDGLPATNTATATLSGSGTPNPNNDTFTYEWKEGTNVVGNAVSLNVTRPVGTYTFTLTVTDSNGDSGTDDVTLTVTPEPNQAPIANAGLDQTVAVSHDGNPLTNTASIHLASLSTDPESDPLTFEWWEGSNLLGTGAGSNVQRPVGTYTFTLNATDSYGAQTTDTVVVTVTPESNQAPVANAGPDKTYAVPHDGNPLTNLATFALGGSATDPDSDTLGFAWSQGVTNVGNSASVTVQRPAGVHSFVLTVTDPYGASGNDSVVITVTPEPNAPPKAVADQFTIKRNTTAMLPVLKNDKDGDGDPLTLVSVTATGLNVAIVSNQIRYIPATNFLGTVNFTYTMRDPYGVTSSANVKVKVSNGGASGYTP